jgi:hypothetical protein
MPKKLLVNITIEEKKEVKTSKIRILYEQEARSPY